MNSTHLQQSLNRLSLMIVSLFVILAFGTIFWSLWERDNLRARADNPRGVLSEQNLERGRIYARGSELLAYSQTNENRNLGITRIYPYPSAVSAVGYYSYTFGAAGIEEANADILIADGLRPLTTELTDNLLNRDVVGGDVQTTIDVALQNALVEAMQDSPAESGAAVMVAVPSGDILAMTSLPIFDPNEQDILQDLIGKFKDKEQSSSRLLNRTVDGEFQPGGSLQSLILAAMLVGEEVPANTVDARDLLISEPPLRLTCNTDLGENLALGIAFLEACPRPFVIAVGDQVSLPDFINRLSTAELGQPLEITGFPVDDRIPYEADLSDDPRLDAAGQGMLTVSPFHMVQMAAAWVNEGVGVPLRVVSATRYPFDAESWEPLIATQTPPAIMQPSSAATIAELMRSEPLHTEPLLFGHSSAAFAGDKQLSWFLGWVPLDDGSEIAIVIVLEADEIDPTEASDVAIETVGALSGE